MDDPTTVERTRVCSKCGVEKPLTAFAKASWCRDGRRGQCKACRLTGGHVVVTEKACTGCGLTKSVADFQRRTASPDGYHQRCKECRRAPKAAEYARNRATYTAKNRAAYEAQREIRLEYQKRWSAENRTKRREVEARRRARKRGALATVVDVDALWTGKCALCGDAIDLTQVAPHPMSRSLDHIVPLSLGGSHEQSNLQWTHLRCNIRKGARLTA